MFGKNIIIFSLIFIVLYFPVYYTKYKTINIKEFENSGDFSNWKNHKLEKSQGIQYSNINFATKFFREEIFSPRPILEYYTSSGKKKRNTNVTNYFVLFLFKGILIYIFILYYFRLWF